MSKRVKFRVSSICCKRFYSLYDLCNSSLNCLIRKLSEFIEKEKKRKEKTEIDVCCHANLMEFHNAETDS